jgi:hypothetical protein
VDAPDGLALKAEVLYFQSDPLTIRMMIEPREANQVEWLLARAMARAALCSQDVYRNAPLGRGDVQFAPSSHEEFLEIRLQPRGERCTLLVPRRRLASFLDETYRLIPDRREHEFIDWEREVRELLKPTRTQVIEPVALFEADTTPAQHLFGTFTYTITHPDWIRLTFYAADRSRRFDYVFRLRLLINELAREEREGNPVDGPVRTSSGPHDEILTLRLQHPDFHEWITVHVDRRDIQQVITRSLALTRAAVQPPDSGGFQAERD